eukprot:TRINITY_DN3813_c0_g2_i1.p3 TRINITY_DN3813_c0_g2~~TRINITY_DN3813_c0_g2_i1.p3  ORF type:complete len:131 (+),score=22.65 TRINITY_DN3813_c0_g2_i1:59-451(+)
MATYESSVVYDLGPINGTITLCNIGVFLKVLSLLQHNPTQLKVSEEKLKLLQILNDGELLVKLEVISNDTERPFYHSELNDAPEAYKLPVEEFEDWIRIAGDPHESVAIHIDNNKFRIVPDSSTEILMVR